MHIQPTNIFSTKPIKANNSFICGSIEPGNDGVRRLLSRLSGELARSGHEVQIISLCDKQVNSFLIENELKSQCSCRRIPMSANNKQRLTWTQEVLE
jgi:hypothetical protein